VAAPFALECVINISEGRRPAVIEAIAAAAGPVCLDVHRDGDHNRSVLTLAGPGPMVEAAARGVASATVAAIDLRQHGGVHPRIGALDVVPFVPWTGASMGDAIAARDAFARWATAELALPCLLYGPERTLPEVRRTAFAPHPTAGGCAVGARPVLVAYNLWLEANDVALAKRVAAALRSPTVRSLGLQVGRAAQVSCNLLDPLSFGPAAAFDAVAAHTAVARAELVGLLPAAALAAVPTERWPELDLARSRTIEARLEEAGFD
jgi:glutamate formiminotransferase / 5-formyltetrahydrofolate cyclo-ligase